VEFEEVWMQKSVKHKAAVIIAAAAAKNNVYGAVITAQPWLEFTWLI